MLFLAPRAPRWAPILRPVSIRGFLTLAQLSLFTKDLDENMLP